MTKDIGLIGVQVLCTVFSSDNFLASHTGLAHCHPMDEFKIGNCRYKKGHAKCKANTIIPGIVLQSD